MRVWATVVKALERHGRCAMVTVAAVEGSAPREPGARLLVMPEGFHGTIGGGALEWRALAHAQGALAGKNESVSWVDRALGPDLGQCCGGRVKLLTEVLDARSLSRARRLAAREKLGMFSTRGSIGPEAIDRGIEEHGTAEPVRLVGQVLYERFGEAGRPLYLFGAGHVGRALTLALAPLPFAVTWVDGRPDAFPGHVPANVTTVRADDPAAQLMAAPAASFVLVMTHSHALDLDIVLAALAADRFPYVGLIGSATKRARFSRRLAEAGVTPSAIERLVCPIGIGGIGSKHPAAIAAATAAELLVRDEEARALQLEGLNAGQDLSSLDRVSRISSC